MRKLSDAAKMDEWVEGLIAQLYPSLFYTSTLDFSMEYSVDFSNNFPSTWKKWRKILMQTKETT